MTDSTADETSGRQQRPCGEVRKAHGGHQYMLGARVYDCPGGQHTHHDSHTHAPARTDTDHAEPGPPPTDAERLWTLETAIRRVREAVTIDQPSAFPEVQGHCPACRGSSLFLASGGYVTCSRIDCPEPDAASTLLERRTDTDPAPDGLREQYAAALRAKADAVLAIRDRELEQLRESREDWKAGMTVAVQRANRAESALAALRTRLEGDRDEVRRNAERARHGETQLVNDGMVAGLDIALRLLDAETEAAHTDTPEEQP